VLSYIVLLLFLAPTYRQAGR